jgi:NAD-dependent dihydropyrimidine dehydrogenase PreA subunit
MNETVKSIAAKHILFCKCAGERIHTELLSLIDEHLKTLPVEVTVLSDLCGLVAKRKDLLSGLFRTDAEYMVIGCFPRTMNLIFDQVKEQTGQPGDCIHVNLIETSAQEAIHQIEEFCGDYKNNMVYREITGDTGWPSWYPVIDYTRCTACGQCADFCLFGVYEKNKSRVQVVNPMGCKNNCPACARICPQTAIIFPKYKQGGAIGGSKQIDEIAEHTRQAKDIREILGGDIYSALEQRKQKRKSIILHEAMRKAQEERDQAILESKP